MRSRANRNWMRWAVVGVVVGVVAIVVWKYWPGREPAPADADAKGGGGGVVDVSGGGKKPPASSPAVGASKSGPGAPATQKAPANGAILKLQEMSPAAATERVKKGNELLAAKKLHEGRVELSKALLSGKLPAGTDDVVRKTLTDLAGRMIFSAEVFDGDPYTMQYTFRPREMLARVERTEKLHVPTQMLLSINRIAKAESIRAGQTIKVIRGPFHAVVTKSAFTMDIYLRREGFEPVFVKRLKVGVGKNGSTPVGLWRVGLGNKLVRAPWFPPPNSPVRRSLRWGEEGYPLGKMGYWIGLEGIEEATTMHTGYGIHGTNEPDSIGQAASLGCIRLADADIELVFSLLYEKWSTVRVRA